MGTTYNVQNRIDTLKHRSLGFDDAYKVIEGDNILLDVGDRFNYDEERLFAIGPLNDLLVVVVWTEREMITTSSLCEKQMDQKKTMIEEKWIDPDDAPELTDDWFARAEVRRDGKVVRRGRPRLSNPKQQVALRIDPDVIDRFKADGAGWQSRMNEALRKAVGL